MEHEQLTEILANSGISLARFREREGGTSYVHRGKDIATGGEVAIKEFKAAITSDPRQVERVKREFGLSQRLSSTNLSKGLDLIESGSEILFVMEWINGQPVDHLSPAECTQAFLVQTGLSLANAVGALHDAGVFHRDIKPENVIIATDERPVLVDLGIALVRAGDQTRVTSDGQFLGSWRYASPQFMRGEDFTPSDDVYGLGTVLFRIVTGKDLFGDEKSKPEIARRALTEQHRRVAPLGGFEAWTATLVEGCLAFERRNRPTIDQLVSALTEGATSEYVGSASARIASEKASERVRACHDEDVYFSNTGAFGLYKGQELTVIRAITIAAGERAEKWVADIEVMRINDGIAHAKKIHRHFVHESSPLQSAYSFLTSGGHWTKTVSHEEIRVGDLVVSE